MSYSPGKDKNMFGSLTRAMRQAWIGDQAGIDQIAIPNLCGLNEFLPVANSTQTSPIPMIGVSPGGIPYSPIPTLATYNVTLNAALGNTRFFISDSYYRVAGVRFIYKTAGTSAAIGIQITKDVQGQAPGTGLQLLATAFDGVNTAIDTTVSGTLVSTTKTLYLNPGDTLSVSFTGTLTTIAGVCITVDMFNTCNIGPNGPPAVLVNNQALQIPPYVPGGTIKPFGQTVPSNVAMYYVHRNADLSTTPFFVANRDMTVVAAYAVIGTAFASAITLDITRDIGTNAPGAGSSILTAPMSVTGTVNTLIIPLMNATTNRLNMLAGDRLSVKYSATTTGADVAVLIVFAPIYDRIEQSFFLGPNAQQQVAQYFMIANRLYEVVDLSCVFGTAAGGAAKLLVTIDKQLNAPGSGNAVQTDNTSAGFDMNATANTVQVGTPNILRDRLMSVGDRLGLSPTGAAQATANTCITVSLRQHA
jgi:hypothetical protein